MKSNPRVLFVGRDPADASLLELVLTRDLPAARVVHLADPVSFGREIERGDFDLVVCDEQLDWMDGAGVRLEVGRGQPAVPVIVLSAQAPRLAAGADSNGLTTRLDKSSASFLRLPEILDQALKRAEEERRHTRIEPRIRSLLEHSRVGVFQSTLTGQLLDADQTFLDLLGARSLEEAMQLDLSGLTPRPSRGFPETGKLYRHEQALSGTDGRLIRVALTELVTLDERGLPVLDGFLEDVGEPARSESQPGEELPGRRTEEDLRLFASLVVHELKEPLRSIEQSTRMMIEDTRGNLPGEAGQSADLVVAGVRRLQSLLDGLRALVRAAGDPGSLESCDCNDLVNEVLEDLRERLEETQARVTVNALPTVRADPNRLRLLFSNLLSNAVKFHAGNPPSIEVAARQDGEDWIFSVRDDGVGIEPEMTDRIFERFVHSGDQEGTGLGLTICKEVVEHCGGRIWAESRPGHGSTFYFTLPVLAARRGGRGNGPSRGPAAGETSSGAHEEAG